MSSNIHSQIIEPQRIKKSNIGLIVSGVLGTIGLALVGLTTPFVLPALRKHCLPYVPATDVQLKNLSRAFRKHAIKGDSFLDIGSGDGRVCRLSSKLGLFSRIDGVELNYVLVIFSRLVAIRDGHFKNVKYHHRDLWQYPINKYDAVCIFGVETMMKQLQEYILLHNTKPQTIYACRFPFDQLDLVDEIGSGIDTVWIYKLNTKMSEKREDVFQAS